MTREEKYVDLTFDYPTPVIIPEESEQLCRVSLMGCKSPVTICVAMKEKTKADLTMYLSTEVKEPNATNCMREVEMLSLFYFGAKNKGRFFEQDDVLYITAKSGIGCCITIMPKHC